MKLKPNILVIFFALIWLLVGSWLLSLGAGYLSPERIQGPVFNFLVRLFNTAEVAATFLLVFALVVGYCKGKFVLSKRAEKNLAKIGNGKEKIAVSTVFSWAYVALIAFMMGLGMLMRYLEVPNDIRGVIDLAVGFALMFGGIYTLRRRFLTFKS